MVATQPEHDAPCSTAPGAGDGRRPPRIPRPAPAPRCASPLLAELGTRFRAARPGSDAVAGDPRLDHAVEEFWAGPGARSPLLERDAAGRPILTFLYRSPSAHGVLLLVNRLADGTDLAHSELERLPGTDIWHLSYALEPEWRGSYGFLVHQGPDPAPWRSPEPITLRALFQRAHPDPRNPQRCPNRSGHSLSVAEGPAAPPQRWLRPPARDDVGPTALRTATGPDGRRCWVFDHGTGPRPLWVILDGEVWAEQFDLGATLEAMIRAGEAPPLSAILVDSGGVEHRWDTLGGGSSFVDELADGYLPWARRLLDAPAPAGLCGVAGQSLGGVVALRCGLERPDAFGMVLSQSASLWLGERTLERIPGSATDAETRFRLEVGTHEWMLLEPHRALHRRMTAVGIDAECVEYAGGHDYAWWRGALPEGLVALGRSSRTHQAP
ncbi:enterochelin esterase domain-containing protein [Leucobacter sp.]